MSDPSQVGVLGGGRMGAGSAHAFILADEARDAEDELGRTSGEDFHRCKNEEMR